jgi:hypothetical protein
MLERAECSVVTKRSNRSVGETVERLKSVIEARSFTLLRSSITAPQPNELVCRYRDEARPFGKPAVARR